MVRLTRMYSSSRLAERRERCIVACRLRQSNASQDYSCMCIVRTVKAWFINFSKKTNATRSPTLETPCEHIVPGRSDFLSSPLSHIHLSPPLCVHSLSSSPYNIYSLFSVSLCSFLAGGLRFLAAETSRSSKELIPTTSS